MRNIVILLLLVVAGWQGFSQYQRRTSSTIEPQQSTARPLASPMLPEGKYKCDGRTYCSQMTSCAEATYFLRNCPGTKMDGDNDGIPCEQQWC